MKSHLSSIRKKDLFVPSGTSKEACKTDISPKISQNSKKYSFIPKTHLCVCMFVGMHMYGCTSVCLWKLENPPQVSSSGAPFTFFETESLTVLKLTN